MRIPYSTRQWKHPEGYKYLALWTNAVLLRFLVRKFTETLPSSEYRTKTQLDDSARSVVSNIEEGYKRATTREYLNFIGFSQGSLEEIKGLVRQVCQDGFLKSKPNSCLADIRLDLKEIKGLLRESKGLLTESKELPRESKGLLTESKELPRESKGGVTLEGLCSSLKSIRGAEMTYEMFIEIINKTDWLFRKLVESLEKKLNNPGSLKKKYQKQADEFDKELKSIVEKAKYEPR